MATKTPAELKAAWDRHAAEWNAKAAKEARGADCDCPDGVDGREARGPHHLHGCPLEEPATAEGRALRRERSR